MINKQEVLERIVLIIQSVLQDRELGDTVTLDNIKDDTNLFTDLRMDSIEILTVITEIENEYDTEFLDEDMDMDKMIIVGNIVNGLMNAATI